MEIEKKLEILSDAAKYDASCASSGSVRNNLLQGIGTTARYGICHSWTEDGRCISLLKILFTNHCVYDCSYCINRRSNDIARTMFTPDEVVDLTFNFYRRNYIEGLFLSSGIVKNPDYTMESLLQVVKKLREKFNYNGYIHLKAIPGANIEIIRRAGFYVDRMSVNIELPAEESLKLLAPDKKKDDIFKPMSDIEKNITINKEEKRYQKKISNFVPAGQTTQLIIGASPDSDFKIMNLASHLYHHFKLQRVYYSAYVPVPRQDKKLPAITKPPLKREHRLYQADWLLRFYRFEVNEIIDEKNPNFDENFDPKLIWALKNLHFFPVEINKAAYHSLLRVPGIGVRSAERIVSSRKFSILRFEDLKKIGVVLKRARFFITCNGKFLEQKTINETTIKAKLLEFDKKDEHGQLYLFDNQEN